MSSNIINTSSSRTIFSKNKENIVETTSEDIILSDTDIREVIKKGYLLSQINLAEIPDIIQDAINQAITDAKTQTLSDALIQTLKDSLDNLDSGVYKKTYIDNTISYIENIALSKVNNSTLAGIISNQITYAIENLATTSQVSTLNSRVGDSESEITNVKNTINTKDLARANQITQLEASIDETFAGYSDAIDLYVDANGNVKSQKIETLTTNIGLQLQEINQLIVDADNNWKATSTKLITSPTGAITGYSFLDGSGLKSTFEINADNFKIANAYNTYSPFSIVGTSLYFNGKVNFSNVTGSEGIVTSTNIQSIFNSNITTIDGGKITTYSINADKIASYYLTAQNATFGNAIIGNAQIQDGSINNAKIENLSVNNAKIADASITNAKITDLSVSTFKIQDEAIIVPRYASGIGSCTIIYTPTTSHNCLLSIFISSYPQFTYGPGFDYILKINGVIVKRLQGEYYTQLNYLQHFVYLNAGTTYTFNFTTLDGNHDVIETESSLFLLGVKK